MYQPYLLLKLLCNYVEKVYPTFPGPVNKGLFDKIVKNMQNRWGNMLKYVTLIQRKYEPLDM